MKTDDFNFDLPEERIAQYPTGNRGDSRLLVLDRASGALTHAMVGDIAAFLEPGSLMVFNDSRVRKARLFGTAGDTGSSVEFLLLRRSGADTWEAACSKTKRQRPGRLYSFPEGVTGEIVGAEGDTRTIRFSPPIGDDYLDRVGHIPLPPYIKREDAPSDAERYQTVYSKNVGSSASPTAGLHFTQDILESLARAGMQSAWVTLHVGLGTFLPVRSERLEDHVMHREEYSIPAETAAAVTRAKDEGRPVVAVGTTSLRTLESAWTDSGLAVGPGSTSIFIYPGYDFNVVERLFTNFHTPKSTLLMLVSAFAGRERILDAYAEAIREKYRFFSYGDAMLIR